MIDYFTSLSINYMTIFALNLVLSAIAISLERKNPTATLAWLFFMTSLPGIGFLFFILLSQNISKRKIFKYTAEESELYTSFLAKQARSFKEGTFQFNDVDMAWFSDMILFHNRLSESFYSQNNQISVFTDGHTKFNDLIMEIEKATHHIHVLYYILKNDDLGNQLLNLLSKKAREGVQVRILLDHVGARSLPKHLIQAIKNDGCEVAFFFPSKLKYLNFKANYRNHRKIVVIDGMIGYVGGFNIGVEYIGESKKFGFWRDTHLKILGDSVISLQLRFFLDWRHASKKLLEISTQYIKESSSTGHAGVQIVSSGPDSIHEQIKQGYIKMINKARNYIYIQTPYFVPDESILEALKIAAASGVEVRIMIPSIPDHLFVHWATYSHIGELLPYGVRVFIYEKGFLHSKTIVVDDIICSAGTCNFDIRSFRLNFEVNAFIYDKDTTSELKTAFDADLNYCREMTLALYQNRSLLVKTKETVSRLFSPLL
ncbi:MAG: cardiolipin synthase [Firmicutes bacterium HGW-Firmicutes-1]|nr:MAG: cardiolipin synthase [Firmicutes bacterium HGW-Firmicutes-1]